MLSESYQQVELRARGQLVCQLFDEDVVRLYPCSHQNVVLVVGVLFRVETRAYPNVAMGSIS
jgi:hypothetical protein